MKKKLLLSVLIIGLFLNFLFSLGISERMIDPDEKGYNSWRIYSGSSRDVNFESVELVDVLFDDARISIMLPLDWEVKDGGYFTIQNPENYLQKIETSFRVIDEAVEDRLVELATISNVSRVEDATTVYDYVEPIEDVRFVVILEDEPKEDDVFYIKFYPASDEDFMSVVDYIVESIYESRG